jgi:hypothetical protein
MASAGGGGGEGAVADSGKKPVLSDAELEKVRLCRIIFLSFAPSLPSTLPCTSSSDFPFFEQVQAVENCFSADEKACRDALYRVRSSSKLFFASWEFQPFFR